jgi:transposase
VKAGRHRPGQADGRWRRGGREQPGCTRFAEKSTRLQHIWADSNYSGELVEWWQTERGITIEIVGKQPNQHTFVVAPRRWVVERTLATLGRARRLSKDYEQHDIFSESMVYLASIGSLLRRLAPNAMTATRYRITSAAA